jgi:hypothetical protein
LLFILRAKAPVSRPALPREAGANLPNWVKIGHCFSRIARQLHPRLLTFVTTVSVPPGPTLSTSDRHGHAFPNKRFILGRKCGLVPLPFGNHRIEPDAHSAPTSDKRILQRLSFSTFSRLAGRADFARQVTPATLRHAPIRLGLRVESAGTTRWPGRWAIAESRAHTCRSAPMCMG